jgi:HEPN domain-containing protein
MKASTREWIAKAEEDFAAATTLARPRKKTSLGTVCFHAEQCVEKYLKARLNEASIALQRTHDLEHLLNAVLPVEPLWAAFRPALKRLTDAAVLPRYPGNVHKSRSTARAEDLQSISKRGPFELRFGDQLKSVGISPAIS